MKLSVNFDDANTARLKEAQDATGLDLAGVFNEAITLYLEAVQARRQAGRELALVNEAKKTYTVLTTPGLRNIPLVQP